MQSSLAVATRALIMLACVVGIPALAMSGASWPDILKKFQDFRLPAILSPTSPSPSAIASEAPPFAPNRSTSGSAGGQAATQTQVPNAAIQPPTVETAPANAVAEPADLPVPPKDLREIQKRLQGLGATYYLLESWGSDQQLYRFYCKVAVGGNGDHTHWFEAVHADPLEAMQQVLRRVETWRGGISMNVSRIAGQATPLMQ